MRSSRAVWAAAFWLSMGNGIGAVELEPPPSYDRLPYLQSLTTSDVIVVSQSEQELSARLEYSRDGELIDALEDPSPGHDHVFHLDGLDPDTVYTYKMFHGEVPFEPSSFRTLPGREGVIRAAVFGDTGLGTEAQRAIASLIEQENVPILIHTGDMAYPLGAPAYYQTNFFKVYESFLGRTCIYPALGNHDCFLSPRYWLDMFHLPASNSLDDESYYSFELGAAHVTVINVCYYDIGEEQLQWIDEDLTQTDAPWKICVLHVPPYSNGAHGGDYTMRQQLVPILEKHQVDLVLQGHEHAYERTYPVREAAVESAQQDPRYTRPGGTIYVITGGGGASLYSFVPTEYVDLSRIFVSLHHYLRLEISPAMIRVEAVNLLGEVFDEFSVSKDGERAPTRFLRGDANNSGSIGLSDAVVILSYLFLGDRAPCLPACDVNRDEELNIVDPVSLLNYLFHGGPPPPPPYPECDIDPEVSTGCLGLCP